VTPAATATRDARADWKLQGRLFTTNEASIALARRCGFRKVGVYERHGRLEGEWKDLLIVERLLGDAAAVEE
jgi:phosphinothricin acetyltransferase